MKKKITLSVFTEKDPGALGRILLVFTRRRMLVESLNGCESEVAGGFCYTLTVTSTEEEMEKAATQIEKIVEVSHVSVHKEKETLIN